MSTDPFEQKFGILADSTLNNKLPEMKNFSIGFQVIDTEDDNSRAFGVQIYNVGKHLVMVPMFWLKGKIKGGEVMYVKDFNRFMPFTESDINNLKSGKTFSMGDPEAEEDKKTKGDAYSVSTMELNWLNTKRAGEVTVIDRADVIKMMRGCPELRLPRLEDIKLFGPKAAADIVETMKNVASFTNNMMRFHTPEEIGNVLMPGLKAGALIEKTASIKPRKALTFIDNPFCKEAAALPLELKHDLMKNGIVAVDARKEASVALKEKKGVTRYATPSASGKYKLLNTDGTVSDADIIVLDAGGNGAYEGPCCCDSKQSSIKSSRCLVVIDGKASYTDADKLTVDTEEIKEASIGKEVTASALKDCLPVKEYKKDAFEQPGHIIVYDKAHDTAYRGDLTTAGNDIVFQIGWGNPAFRIVLTGKPGVLFTEAGIMYVPSTARLIDLSSYNVNETTTWYGVQSSINDALITGGYETVKVASDGSMWRIEDKANKDGFIGFKDAFKYLVAEVGLRAKQAADILEDAKNSASFGRITDGIRFWVKRASFDPADDPWRGVGNDIYETREAGMKKSGPLDDGALKRIDDASKTDVKELFDTQLMTELAKSAYSVDKAKEYLPIIARALDRICRTLVMFYWHNEDFEEKYGKQNIPQLEDALKDNIQSLGSLITYLKDKTVQDEDFEDNEDELQQEMA